MTRTRNIFIKRNSGKQLQRKSIAKFSCID